MSHTVILLQMIVYEIHKYAQNAFLSLRIAIELYVEIRARCFLGHSLLMMHYNILCMLMLKTETPTSFVSEPAITLVNFFHQLQIMTTIWSPVFSPNQNSDQ
jgi:hypothetical protein